MEQIFFVGSYTQGHDNQKKGKGIYTCKLELSSGKLEILDCFEDIVNPTYVALNKARTHLYSLQEIANTPTAQAFSLNKDYSLSRLNTQAMSGGGPCHLGLDANETFLAYANYGSGNIVLYALNDDGSLSEELDSVQHRGKSINPNRQEGPHAHATVFGPDGALYVADLGLDEIKRYHINTQSNKLELSDSVRVPDGHGPRHLVFHPNGNYLFVVNELISSVSVFKHEASKLSLLQTVSTLPANNEVESYCAAIRIHPSGNFIYVSNRGHDSIAVLKFDESQASLDLIQTQSSQGQFPRDFNLDPSSKVIVASNQHSSNLASYWLNSETGKLEFTGFELELGTPVCVAML